jgi:hypothetical protein
MNAKQIVTGNAFFFALLFILFACILFSLYSRYASFPSPLPNEYPQNFVTPEKTR